MADTLVVSQEQRQCLVELAKKDTRFRELIKSDWRAALKQAGINPRDVKDAVIRQTDLSPFKGGLATAGIEITIEIMSVAREERINMSDIVVFDQAKTK